MSDLPSTSRAVVLWNDPRSNERILEFIRELEERESDDEIDDSDADPNYQPSEDSTSNVTIQTQKSQMKTYWMMKMNF